MVASTMPPLMRMMRLDLYLCQFGYANSRTEAKKFIDSGAVLLDGKIVNKSSFQLDENNEYKIEIDKTLKKYVSRGGFKLEGALKEFSISIKGKVCLDIGASSGGFTDCLLQNGAEYVFAVDSGCGQLVKTIRDDERVSVFEGYNARYMKPEDFDRKIDFVTMDVSFISATYIIPSIYDCLDCGGEFVCLIKPQFEVGKSGIGKGGIVKDDKIRNSACDKVVSFAKEIGFEHISTTISSIKGGDGNTEFLAYFRK